jgi:serine/threonine protein phosphatase PrpC
MSERLIVGAVTDVGQVRGHNEDAYLVDDHLGLIAVADGMGGHQAGEVASATALEALRAAVTSGEGVRDAVISANDAVYDKSTTDERLRGMGTTLTVGTLAAGGTLLLGHVGDSRAYLLHDGQLQRLTVDHSLVEELVQAGEITEEEAETDPRRSMITRALGIDPEVEVDLYPVPVVGTDRLMLCSDGLTGMVRESQIEQVLASEPDATRAAQQLVDAANGAGGVDNITVLVVDVVDDEDATAAVPIVGPAPPDDLPSHPEPPAAASDRPRRGRRWWRILRWALPIVLVVAVAAGVLTWYARDTYYVGTDHGNVTIFRGRTGGVLFWDPTVEQRTTLPVSHLPSEERQSVRAGHGQFSSLGGAQAFVRQLRRQATHRKPSPTSTTVPTTTAPTTTPTTVAPGPVPPTL